MVLGFTGAAGFVGSYLVRFFSQIGEHDIRVFARRPSSSSPAFYSNVNVHFGDLTSLEDCKRFVNGIDVLFHLAHRNSPVDSDRDMASDAHMNMIPLLNLLQAIDGARTSRPHVIYFSSGGAIYEPSEDRTPFRETDCCSPSSSYGIQKLMGEHYLRLAAERGSISVAVLRVGNAYGTPLPHQRTQGLIGVALSRAIARRPIRIFGNAGNIRDYIHLDDIAEACRRVLEPSGSISVYNIGSGRGHSVSAVLDLIEQCSGLTLLREETLAGETARWLPDWAVLDIRKAREELHWAPRLNLAEGILRTLEALPGHS